MLFNSYIFLLLFFPATFLIYHLLVKLGKFTMSKAFLVAASLYFTVISSRHISSS